ncbi:allantoate amidohydrolase [Gynuella sunshinyii]|uniref:Acetylornithine deacetylase/Succinyl-diaminopimelate desuccinylase and related deacylase n=1 Tax=Gynuella sunshinyii YC6258 TaxID=1445510 RepID=A0A0C5VJ57_9GAMM|nr:allantoate amidohydrolase [Gynuella sunshinyii]AJQ93433.1 acetylornithine deacetylase/Succinyl-diaminopimelate desuccinylase and related deacylase [Gynuella sunshinyii YC6258]
MADWPELNQATALELARQVLQRCDILAGISQTAGIVDRRYLTPEHRRANDQVQQWMQQAGLNTWQDAAGNQWGRLASSNREARTLIIGSHLDTVPNAGKYDGIVGVLAPLALVAWLQQHQIALPFHLDIVGFGDEEGVRFGTTLLGSRALTGSWPEQWRELSDGELTLPQALEQFGSSFEAISQAAVDPQQLLGYFEFHIEQGPVLEGLDLPLGVVTAIAGARRFNIELCGMAGHAGTVPMELRQDALMGAAELMQVIESIARDTGIVATVGRISAAPGAVNVIPGRVELSLDIRSEDDQLRDQALADIEGAAQALCQRRGLEISWTQIHSAAAVQCDPQLTNLLASAIGEPAHRLPSGAGHDAMVMAQICPMAMLFMRCEKGISHHPAEAITESDLAEALMAMHRFLPQLAVLNK